MTTPGTALPRRSCVSFELPFGFPDRSGAVHREGRMRPASARDEMQALGDFRVHLRPESFPAVLLARVVVRLGRLERAHVNAGLIERLEDGDREHLERLYREINGYPLE